MPPTPSNLRRLVPLSSRVSRWTWCLTSTETIRLIRDGEKQGKGEITYLSLHCHHLNDSCIKMGSNESHFNISVRAILMFLMFNVWLLQLKGIVKGLPVSPWITRRRKSFWMSMTQTKVLPWVTRNRRNCMATWMQTVSNLYFDCTHCVVYLIVLLHSASHFYPLLCHLFVGLFHWNILYIYIYGSFS